MGERDARFLETLLSASIKAGSREQPLTGRISATLSVVSPPVDERLWTVHAPTPDGSTWTENYTLRGLGGEVLRDFELVGGTVSGSWSETDTIHRDGRVLAVVSPSETQHASLDHLGTPRLWTGPGGVVRKRPEHLPYGEPAVSSDQKFQFTGHERDERGAGTTDDLDYMHARYYSPHLGRFLSVDPLIPDSGDPRVGRSGFLPEPQRWNRYAYVHSSPLSYIDSDGRAAEYALAAELLVPSSAAASGGGALAVSAGPVAVGGIAIVSGVGLGYAVNQIPGVSEALTNDSFSTWLSNTLFSSRVRDTQAFIERKVATTLEHINRYSAPDPNDPDDRSNKKNIYDRMKKHIEQARSRIKRLPKSQRDRYGELLNRTERQLEKWWAK